MCVCVCAHHAISYKGFAGKPKRIQAAAGTTNLSRAGQQIKLEHALHTQAKPRDEAQRQKLPAVGSRNPATSSQQQKTLQREEGNASKGDATASNQPCHQPDDAGGALKQHIGFCTFQPRGTHTVVQPPQYAATAGRRSARWCALHPSQGHTSVQKCTACMREWQSRAGGGSMQSSHQSGQVSTTAAQVAADVSRKELPAGQQTTQYYADNSSTNNKCEKMLLPVNPCLCDQVHHGSSS